MSKVPIILNPIENVLAKFLWEGKWESYAAGTFVMVFSYYPSHDPEKGSRIFYGVSFGSEEEILKALLQGHEFVGFGMVMGDNTVGIMKPDERTARALD